MLDCFGSQRSWAVHQSTTAYLDNKRFFAHLLQHARDLNQHQHLAVRNAWAELSLLGLGLGHVSAKTFGGALLVGAVASACQQLRHHRPRAKTITVRGRCGVVQRNAEAWYEPYAPPPKFAGLDVLPSKFEPGDPAALQHLRKCGYVVFRSVLSVEEVTRATDLFWDFMHACTGGRVKKDNLSTWGDLEWPGQAHNGIINSDGIGQSPFMWYVRTRQRVLQAFACIWEVHDPTELLVSFDGACAFRPPSVDAAWRTAGGWFHTDQNGMTTGSGFVCAQGLVNLSDAGKMTGGFAVLPKSHEFHQEVFQRWPLERNNDFFVLPRTDPLLAGLGCEQPQLLNVKAGDLIVWDSRCIHCNVPAPHRFDSLALYSEMATVGLEASGSVLTHEFTSVADAARLVHTEGHQELEFNLLRRGIPQVEAKATARQLRIWADELAADHQKATLDDPGETVSRLAAYVCTVPRSHVGDGILYRRMAAALLGATTNHWPNRVEITCAALGSPSVTAIGALDLEALRLIGCEGSSYPAAVQQLIAIVRDLRSRADQQFAHLLFGLESDLMSRISGS